MAEGWARTFDELIVLLDDAESNPLDAAYPVLARTLAARRDNLKATVATLEERLASLQGRADKVPA
jgi:BMFP domain-containing protein YqiC